MTTRETDVVDGWHFDVIDGAWAAQCPWDGTVHVSLSEDGDGINIQDATRYYPGGNYTIPFLVIDELRKRGSE